MDKRLWNQPAPLLPGQGARGGAVIELPTAEEVAVEFTTVVSRQQLEDRGWCLWRCEGLGGDVIVVIISELITNYPKGYPVYTLQELKDILDMDDRFLQAAHRAKKELGARIEGPEGPTEGVGQ